MSERGRRKRADARRRRGERGVLLVALLMGMTVMIILLTASAQSWTAIIQREMEQELIFRGNQYVEALRVYQQEHGGTFPTKLEDLMEEGPRGHRYIRQLFPDPFSEDGTWNLLYLGPDGKSAFNPNSPYGAAGVPGLPGLGGAANAGVPGLNDDRSGGLGSSGLGGSGGLGSTSASRQGGTGFGGQPVNVNPGGRRRSRFESGNLNSPIVGVVSKGTREAFNENVPFFEGRIYYNEWEFHVFLKDIPQVQGGVPGRQVNINPQGLIGPSQQIYEGPRQATPGQGANVPAPPAVGGQGKQPDQ